jgi:hypothetical protein
MKTGKMSMLTDIIETMRISASNDDVDSRRSYERREMDECVAIVNGKAYPVLNWSQGGLLLAGDTKEFSMNDILHVVIKFKIAERIMNVEHKGRVLRKGPGQLAIQFSPLTQEVDRQFQHVIDDYVARQFALSQA